MPEVQLCRVVTHICWVCLVFQLFSALELVADDRSGPLPIPEVEIPDQPKFPPMVVTAGGQRRLLATTQARVHFNEATGEFQTNKPGWWLINFPWDRIEGLPSGPSGETALTVALGQPVDTIQNWYLRTAPEPGEKVADEPPIQRGPAIAPPPPKPTLYVRAKSSLRGADGSRREPFRTISQAVDVAGPGDTIVVAPGLYRETVKCVTPGTADAPITIHGIADSKGNRPVISGNDLAPSGPWQSVPGQPGLFRSPIWTGQPAMVTIRGRRIAERTLASELEPYQYSLNWSDRELAFPKLDGDVEAIPGQAIGSTQWQSRSVDDEGLLSLPEKGVYYLSSWVWIPPEASKEKKLIWDPRFPEPLTGRTYLKGRYRAARQSGSPIDSQSNQYRLWIDGKLMPAAALANRPRAKMGYGRGGDEWQDLPLHDGWNHIVVLLDSRDGNESDRAFRFKMPKGSPKAISSAIKPADLRRPPPASNTQSGSAGSLSVADYVTQWSVARIPLGETDEAVYLRVPEGVDPNDLDIDMGKRQEALVMEAPYWTVRNFELRHGSQFQQRSLVEMKAAGCVLEHCYLHHTEVRTLTLVLNKWDGADDPIVVRGNWFVLPGSLGIGASGSSQQLTPGNQTSQVPGRGRAIIEHNVVLNNNVGGFRMLWESGGMKFFRMTGCVVRHNQVVGGGGPGIWFDWEHFNNRIDGNVVTDVPAFGIGVEASPGPMLIANNVVREIRHGGAWFKYGLLAWSSGRIWSVGNTIDSDNGFHSGEGNSDRNTAWKQLSERHSALINSLVMADKETLHRGNLRYLQGSRLFGGGKLSGINKYSRWPRSMTKTEAKRIESGPQLAGDRLPTFPGISTRGDYDYRLSGRSPLARAGVRSVTVSTDGKKVDPVTMNRHDFYGLLRMPEDPVPAGAFRVDPPMVPGQTMIEIESTSGEMRRF